MGERTEADLDPVAALQAAEHVLDDRAQAPHTDGAEISYEEFGRNYIRTVLPTERLLRTIDAVLGDRIELGPIGAGPGRALATVTVLGLFRPTTGRLVAGDRPGELLTFDVDLPIDVTFDLDLRMDRQRFTADLVVPLRVVVHAQAPARLRIEIQMPAEDRIRLDLSASTRRGGVLQKATGMEAELRRFLLVVLRTELDKPYVRRATHLDMKELIDGSWVHLSSQFLPGGPEDRS